MLKAFQHRILNIHLAFTYALFFVLPLQDKLLPLFISLWLFTWLVWRFSPSAIVQSPNKFVKRGLLCLVVFIVFNFVSTLWGNEYEMAGKIIERRLSLLIASVFLYFGTPSQINVSKLSKFYLLGSVVSLLVFFSQFIFQFVYGDVLKFQVDVVGIETYINQYKHPAYLSLNLVLSLFLYFSIHRKGVKLPIVSLLIIDAIFILFIFISGSRAGFLSIAVLNVGVLGYVAKQAIGVKKTLIIAIPMLLLFSIGIIKTEKFGHILDDSENVDVRAPRKVLWKSAIELASDKLLFGYGLGESKERFVEVAVEEGMSNGTKRQYNCHNQYLETVLESGLVSLFLLFASLVFLYKGVKKEQRSVFLGMMGLMAFAFMFESMFLRIAAITLFVGLLIITTQLSKKQEIPQKYSWLDNMIPYASYFAFGLLLIVFLLLYRSTQLSFDPALPETYASKTYIVISSEDSPVTLPQELQGKELSICKFDSTSTASLWSDNTYMLNRIEAKKLAEGEMLTFSTYCYVSKDFDGTWVRASVDRTDGGNLGSSYYNIRKKGTWQKLTVVIDDKVGEMPAYHYFCKQNSNSFEDLKGYVLFAYPEYIISKKQATPTK